MCICIFPRFPNPPMCFFFFMIQNNPNIMVGTTVNMTNMAAKNNITISCANNSITVTKRNAILNEWCIIPNGAITGHISILNGRNINLIKPILLTSLILVSFDASRSRLPKSHATLNPYGGPLIGL
jgi:hypothetical protein